ncbi:MAG TPA: hypothetical protein VGK73_17985 [Polyangiaceae bacterium]
MKFIAKALLVVGFGVSGCAMDAGEAPEAVELESAALRANHLHYDEVLVPEVAPGYDLFGPTGVAKHGDIFGSGLDCNEDFSVCEVDLLKLDLDGNFTTVAVDFSVVDVNDHGDSGGCVIDNDTGTGQAAIAHPNGRIEVLPRLAAEISSCILQISDSETALVQSFGEAGETLYVSRNRRTFPVVLPEGSSIRDINDKGELAGIIATGTPEGNRAFRYDSRTQTTTILEPVAGDPNSWGLGINRQGEVLGYSFVFSAVERVGKWKRNNQFQIAFVEGTPEFPTVSNQLIWNEKELIVVSDTNDGNTYLIPKPGTRLNLADLVEGGAVPPLFAYSINEKGDFLAQTLDDFTFRLYVRTN